VLHTVLFVQLHLASLILSEILIFYLRLNELILPDLLLTIQKIGVGALLGDYSFALVLLDLRRLLLLV